MGHDGRTDTRATLGERLRASFKESQAEERLRNKERRQRVQKPFMTETRELIKQLPGILMDNAHLGSYTDLFSIKSSPVFKPNLDKIFDNSGEWFQKDFGFFFDDIYDAFTSNGGGVLLTEFCNNNGLDCKLWHRKGSDTIYFKISWE